MKKLALVLFILVGLLIIFFAVKKHWVITPEETPIESRGFSLTPFGNEQITTTAGVTTSGALELTSFISLLPGENLINVYSIDFDKDRFDDQIIAVKSADSPFIRIIVGLYNPLLDIYERSYELTTEIKQERTFSFTVMDITGTHENALIVEGYSSNNESILQAWLPKKDENNFELELIVDLKAEGTIVVEQLNRNDAYAHNLDDGSSFPIWTYTSDPNAHEGSLDQLHIMYDWDKDERQYVQIVRKIIAGKTINAQELAKIQDGTEKTFASFLDSLWEKSTGFVEDNLFLFFDYAEKEIIFAQGDTQEIYSWEWSVLRRNGIVIHVINKSISNLSRRIDITLISVDEIRIKIIEYLGMKIDSAAVWDGNYKKQNISTFYASTATQSIAGKDSDIAKLLQTTSRTIWECDNGYDIGFVDSIYTANTETAQEIGVFSIFEVQGETFIQLRDQNSNGILTGFYRPEIVEAETPTENLVGTRIILSPIKIRAGVMEPAMDKILTMELALVD